MAAAPPPRDTLPPSPPTPGTPQRPQPTEGTESNVNESNATLRPSAAGGNPPKKKRNHRGGKKKRTRRQSFALSTEDGSGMPESSQRKSRAHEAARSSFYRIRGANLSDASIDSEALLDHR